MVTLPIFEWLSDSEAERKVDDAPRVLGVTDPGARRAEDSGRAVGSSSPAGHSAGPGPGKT